MHGGFDKLTGEIRTNGFWWPMKPNSYARHRFPPEIIRLAVWLNFSVHLELS
jgi:hypothetical protein